MNSVNDAVMCFLTTKIHYLVVGNYLIRKSENIHALYSDLFPSMQRYVILEEHVQYRSSKLVASYKLSCNYSAKYDVPVSRTIFDVLIQADGHRSLRELMALAGVQEGQEKDVLESILDLWSRRLLVMRPLPVDA